MCTAVWSMGLNIVWRLLTDSKAASQSPRFGIPLGVAKRTAQKDPCKMQIQGQTCFPILQSLCVLQESLSCWQSDGMTTNATCIWVTQKLQKPLWHIWLAERPTTEQTMKIWEEQLWEVYTPLKGSWIRFFLTAIRTDTPFHAFV